MFKNLIFLAAAFFLMAAPAVAAQTVTPADAVVQRDASGRADLPVTVSAGEAAGVLTLTRLGAPGEVARRDIPAAGATVVFEAVPAGLYLACLEGRPDTCRRTGVGDVFLVAGQSNAVSPITFEPPVAGRTGLVAVTPHHGDDDAHAGVEPDIDTMFFPSAEKPARAGACWVRLGDLLAKTGVPVGFVIVARSATNSDCWNPASGACWPLMARALAARKYRAVLWHQGESDALGHFPEEKSLANLTALVTASRDIAPGIPWIVAHNSLRNDIPYADQPVRKAQAALVGQGLACAGPDTDTMREHRDWVGVADFGGSGLAAHGEKWFPAVRAFLDSGTCAHSFPGVW